MKFIKLAITNICHFDFLPHMKKINGQTLCKCTSENSQTRVYIIHFIRSGAKIC